MVARKRRANGAVHRVPGGPRRATRAAEGERHLLSATAVAVEALRTGVLPNGFRRRDAIPHEDERMRVGDPDDDSLAFWWIQYPEAGTYKGPPLEYAGAENMARITMIAPEVQKPETTHVILKVTDRGRPPLSRYKRVIVTIHPD